MTLIEVLISMVILLFVALALVQVVTLTLDVNMKAALQDQAVRLAGERMSNMRNISLSNITAPTAFATPSGQPVVETVRNYRVSYYITNNVAPNLTNGLVANPLGGAASEATSGEVWLINTLVEWQWRGQGSGACKHANLTGDQCYSHLLSAVRSQ